MKKIIVLMLTVLLTVGLTACNNVPEEVLDCLDNPDAPECQVCDDGFHLEGTECIADDPDPDPLVCETGYHVENEECVIDTVTCETGYHEEAGACVIDPPDCGVGEIPVDGVCETDPDYVSPEEVVLDLVIDNFENTQSMAFLAAAMANMDFSTGQTITTEFYLEVEEDLTETHYIDVMITDSFIYDEAGDKVKRDIYLDVDDEMEIMFSMILVEVATGVHVYIQPEAIMSALSGDDPMIMDTLEWVGFTSEWALFKFDDSLESVLSIEVMKEMLVSLFFSEMGDMFFYDLQMELEAEIGFDLDQYGVDLGQFIDYLIEEDFDAAELELQGIDTEGIVLHFDHMYIAWQLYDYFMMYETELAADGFNTGKLQLLNTASYDVGLDEMVVNMPIDPLDGTKAFFDGLTETEIDSLVEIIIKPTLEEAVYEGLLEDVNPEWLENDFEAILSSNEAFFLENWPSYDHTAELADLASLGAVAYWDQLTQDEKGVVYWAIDSNNFGWIVHELERFNENDWGYEWMYKRHREEYDPQYITNGVIDFINNYSTHIFDTFAIDTSNWLTGIENQGVFFWWHDLDEPARIAFMETYGMPGNEGYHETVEPMFHIAMNPWNYGEMYENHNGWRIHTEGLNNDLIMLIQSHQSALENDFGYDVPALIAEIEMYGAIEWYLNYTNDDDRDMLDEISQWNGYQYRWVFDNLEEIMNADEEWYIWWGRMEEYYFMDEMDMYLTQMINDNAASLGMALFDVPGNLMEIQNMGALEWYLNNATQDEKDALNNLLDEFSPNDYHHVMWFLNQNVETPEQFGWCFGGWDRCIDDEWASESMINLVEQYTDHLLIEYGITAQDWVDQINNMGAIEWYLFNIGDWEREILYELAESSNWPYEVLWTVEDIMYQEEDLLAWLTEHQVQLDAIGFDATGKIADLNMYGVQVFVADYLDADDMAILFEEYVYPVLEAFEVAINDGEVPEFIMNEFFTNPHVIEFLGMQDVIDNPIFDAAIIADNFIAIDFDGLVLETVDLELLLQAVYDGQVEYDAFVLGLETTAPNSALILEVLSPGVDSISPYMMYVDDIQYAFDGLIVFEDYLTEDYWMDNLADVDVMKTEDLELLTVLELDGLAAAAIFDDLTVDLNTYLMGFDTLEFPYDTNWECLAEYDPEDCDDVDFGPIIAGLSQLGSAYFHVLFDPNNADWMEIGLDVTDLLDSIADMSYQDYLDNNTPDFDDGTWTTGINAATLTITMSEGAVIEIPAEADVDDVNEIAEDAARFAVTMFARDIFRDLVWHYEQNPLDIPLVETTFMLSELDFLDVSQAFDPEMSTLTIGLPVDPLDLNTIPFELTLYWIDGTEVFNGPITFAELQVLFDANNDLAGQASWDAMVGFVNDTNFHMTKMWLMVMLDDNNNDKYEDDYYEEGNFN